MDAGTVLSLAVPLVPMGVIFPGIAGMVQNGGLARNGALGIRTAATIASDQA